MTFGQKLQDLRMKAGLSQAGLAAKTGIPVKTIQSWEINRRTPRWISLLAKLAKGLDVPMEALAVGTTENKSTPKKGRAQKEK
jgi:transcriptional regulator with XRE-family HTH domain